MPDMKAVRTLVSLALTMAASVSCGSSVTASGQALADRPETLMPPPRKDAGMIQDFSWMESGGEALTKADRAAAATTRTHLEALPGRQELFQEILALYQQDVSVQQVSPRQGQFFFLMRDVNAERHSLFMRSKIKDGLGAQRLVIDANGARSFEIAYVYPSPSGRFVVYGEDRNGDEDATLRIRDVVTGRDLPESLANVRSPDLSWYDDTSFVYAHATQFAERGGVDKIQLSVHQLHTSFLTDRPALTSSDLSVGESDYPSIVTVPGSPVDVGVVVAGNASPMRLSIRSRRGGSWRPIASLDEQIFDMRVNRRHLLAISSKNAPRFKLLSYSFSDPAMPRVLLPESDRVIERVEVTEKFAYVVSLAVAAHTLQRVDVDTGAVQDISLAFPGTISDLLPGDGETVTFRLESWEHPPTWFRLGLDGRAVELRLTDASRPAAMNVNVDRLLATSADGTQVPVTVVRERDSSLPSPRATVLSAYGAYGVSLTPHYSPGLRALLSRGASLATCHVRGGGELGEGWHDAARKERKVRSVEDYIACAELLVARGITTPSQLGAYGDSAAGLTVGPAVVKRPELFGAMVVSSAVLNATRLEAGRNGHLNTTEFGSMAVPGEATTLRALDAYENLTPGRRYPPMLASVGANDTRVPSWHSSKFVSRAVSLGADAMLRVDFDAGHGIALGTTQRAERQADFFAFFLSNLKLAPETQRGMRGGGALD
jgi:prolyl oligopeptidase